VAKIEERHREAARIWRRGPRYTPGDDGGDPWIQKVEDAYAQACASTEEAMLAGSNARRVLTGRGESERQAAHRRQVAAAEWISDPVDEADAKIFMLGAEYEAGHLLDCYRRERHDYTYSLMGWPFPRSPRGMAAIGATRSQVEDALADLGLPIPPDIDERIRLGRLQFLDALRAMKAHADARDAGD